MAMVVVLIPGVVTEEGEVVGEKVGEVEGKVKRTPYSYTEMPNPREDYKECGRGKLSWICDPGKYLTSSEGEYIMYIYDWS